MEVAVYFPCLSLYGATNISNLDLLLIEFEAKVRTIMGGLSHKALHSFSIHKVSIHMYEFGSTNRVPTMCKLHKWKKTPKLKGNKRNETKYKKEKKPRKHDLAKRNRKNRPKEIINPPPSKKKRKKRTEINVMWRNKEKTSQKNKDKSTE